MYYMKSGVSGIFVLIIAVVCSFGQADWQYRDPFMNVNPFSQILFAENRFITQDINRIFTTADGQSWNRNASVLIPACCDDNGIFYANSRYFALGNQGFATSKDLITWDSTIMKKNYFFRSIAYGNGRYVQCAHEGGDTWVLFSSSDGRMWHSDTVIFDANSIVFAKNQFVVVGERILTSPDGISWTRQPFVPRQMLNHVTFADGKYLAVGDSGTVIMSNDGVQWDYKNAPAKYHLISAAYGNGMYVVGGFGSALLASNTGADWNEIYYYPGYQYGRNFVAFGNSRFLATGVATPVGISSDGIAWQVRDYPEYNETFWRYKSINYCHDRFVSMGSGKYLSTSPDGDEWTIFPSLEYSDKVEGTAYSSAAYGAGKYVLVGDTSFISSNGTDWEKIPSGKSGSVIGTFVTFEQDKFIVLNGRDLWTSRDGSDWVLTTNATPGLASLAFGNNTFVAVGGRGGPDSTMKIFSSTDAAIWSPVVIDTDNDENAVRSLTSVAYGNKMFVAVGGHKSDIRGYPLTGYILYSRDGKSWSRVPLALPYKINAITYGGSHFVAVGDSGVIFSSLDGIAWTKRRTHASESLLSITYGNKRFVAVGTGYTSISTQRVTYVSLEKDSIAILSPAIGNRKNQVEITLAHKIITIAIPREIRSRHARVSLFSASGRNLYRPQSSTPDNDRITIRTSGLARGTYLLTVSGLKGADQYSTKINLTR